MPSNRSKAPTTLSPCMVASTRCPGCGKKRSVSSWLSRLRQLVSCPIFRAKTFLQPVQSCPFHAAWHNPSQAKVNILSIFYGYHMDWKGIDVILKRGSCGSAFPTSNGSRYKKSPDCGGFISVTINAPAVSVTAAAQLEVAV